MDIESFNQKLDKTMRMLIPPAGRPPKVPWNVWGCVQWGRIVLDWTGLDWMGSDRIRAQWAKLAKFRHLAAQTRDFGPQNNGSARITPRESRNSQFSINFGAVFGLIN